VRDLSSYSIGEIFGLELPIPKSEELVGVQRCLMVRAVVPKISSEVLQRSREKCSHTNDNP